MSEDQVPYNPQGEDGALTPDNLAQVKAQLQEEQKVRLEAQAAVMIATDTIQEANTRIAELEAALSASDQAVSVQAEMIATLETSLASTQEVVAKVTTLEAALTARDQEIATHQEKAATLARSLADTQAGLAKAANKYRDMLLATRPTVPQELVTGATIEEVDASLARANALVEKVKAAIQAQAAIPAGAPIRTSGPLEGLSPGEKIRLAVRGRGGS